MVIVSFAISTALMEPLTVRSDVGVCAWVKTLCQKNNARAASTILTKAKRFACKIEWSNLDYPFSLLRHNLRRGSVFV